MDLDFFLTIGTLKGEEQLRKEDVLVILSGMNEKATNYTKKVVGSRIKPPSSRIIIHPKF